MRGFRSRVRALAATLLVGVLAALLVGVIGGDSAAAHPLGNFTVNTYSRLDLYADAIRVRYVVDMAEIPTFQERSAIDADGDGYVSQAERDVYVAAKAAGLRNGLHLLVDGSPLPLMLITQGLSFPPGQAGLDTLRIVLTFEAPAAGERMDVDFRDDNFPGRMGWHETVVRPAAGVQIFASTAPGRDVTDELRSYPVDLRSSPPDVRAARFAFVPGTGAPASPLAAIQVSASEPGAGRSGNPFASLVAVERLSLGVILAALFAAIGFGALHALEPGHGKTFVAAYFVGTGGSVRHAMLLGLIVAVSHTVGVLVIGLVALFGSRYILPEELYPWLTLASGLLVIALGLALLLSRVGAGGRLARLLGRRPHRHGMGHAHSHGHDHATPTASASAPSWRSLLAVGLVDGFVPSPSTLVVLLAAISLNRIGLGILLILAFSIGLAMVLACMAVVVLYGRRLLSRIEEMGGRTHGSPYLARAFRAAGANGRLVRLLPVGAALLLVGVGLLYTVRSLSDSALVGI